jgi:hypothetical protein
MGWVREKTENEHTWPGRERRRTFGRTSGAYAGEDKPEGKRRMEKISQIANIIFRFHPFAAIEFSIFFFRIRSGTISYQKVSILKKNQKK